jgi:hypothetical protein
MREVVMDEVMDEVMREVMRDGKIACVFWERLWRFMIVGMMKRGSGSGFFSISLDDEWVESFGDDNDDDGRCGEGLI